MSTEKRPTFGERAKDKLLRAGQRATGSWQRRWSPRPFPAPADGRVLLHLGCGMIDAPGFINVDLLDAPHIHLQTAVDNLSVFADESVDLVYASHCLEHFGYRHRRTVVQEWVRVLKRGGWLRLGVPDFAVIARSYAAGTPIAEIEGPLLGGQDHRLNFHGAIFDEPSLRALMTSVGLTDVRTWDPATVGDHGFSDEANSVVLSGTQMVPLSLNLEGRKS
jgi:SAM-dependent methyltransferase